MRNKPKFSKRIILKAVQIEINERNESSHIEHLIKSFFHAMDSMKDAKEVEIYAFGVKILKKALI